MKKINLLVISLLLLWQGGLYASDDFPPPFRAEYTLYVRGIPIGKGVQTLSVLQDGKFMFETIGETSSLVSIFQDIRIEERSVFKRQANQVYPLEYTYRQTGNKARFNTLLFDWESNKAVNTFKGKIQEIVLQKGTLDRIVYQVVLMQELKQGKRELQYKVAHKGKISIYTPTYLGIERVKTGIGEYETLKYQRISSDGERQTTLWCTPALHYLPARVEHVEEDGEVFRLVLQSVTGLN
jgi:hypothetical protein